MHSSTSILKSNCLMPFRYIYNSPSYYAFATSSCASLAGKERPISKRQACTPDLVLVRISSPSIRRAEADWPFSPFVCHGTQRLDCLPEHRRHRPFLAARYTMAFLTLAMATAQPPHRDLRVHRRHATHSSGLPCGIGLLPFFRPVRRLHPDFQNERGTQGFERQQ